MSIFEIYLHCWYYWANIDVPWQIPDFNIEEPPNEH